MIKEIAQKFPCTIDNEPFEKEHSIEVQLPFLQNLFYPRRQSAADFVKNLKKIGKKIKIIPVLTGNCDYRLISDLIATCYFIRFKPLLSASNVQADRYLYSYNY